VSRIIGLDVGRHRVKAYTDGRFISFPSYTGDYRPLRLERTMTREDYVVELDARYYYVGSIAADASDDGAQSFLQSKAHFDTKLLGLTAIHLLVDDGDEVEVVTGHPVANHVDAEKEAMRELFVGRHQIDVNGIRKHYTITRVTVTSECACATYLLPTKHPIAHGIDGGGATTNLVTWKHGKWIDRLSDTFPFGMDNTSYTIDRYARMVAIASMKRIHEFQGPIYTLGGVAEQLSHSLKQYVRNVPIIPLEEGAFANARAYHTVGKMVSNKLQTQR
jgi:plasmid segregation protein ParM